MKSSIKKAILGVFTLSSLSLSIATQVEAFTPQTKHQEVISNETIYQPQLEIEQKDSQITKEDLIAQSICETRFVNGYYVTCCIDSYGNWACAW